MKLIFPDGGFSQYSTNYHRLLMDTLVQVEAWRAKLGIEPFSESYYGRVRLALSWLKNVCDPKNGSTPNLGANDGAKLFHLTDESYEDFRPTIRLADYYFGTEVEIDNKRKKFVWNQNIGETVKKTRVKDSRIYPNVGLVILRNDTFDAFVRFANFDYRPSQADCLHVDLFANGKNLLCDTGSYSYHRCEHTNFSGTAYHNTIIFDDKDQMPRLSKFLFGHWLEMDEVTAIQSQGSTQSWAGQYTDKGDNCHRRQVLIDQDSLKIIDQISGPFKSGTMNWHLASSEWGKTPRGARSNDIEISVQTSGRAIIELGEGWRSRMYQDKETVPVLRVNLGPGPAKIVTIVTKLN